MKIIKNLVFGFSITIIVWFIFDPAVDWKIIENDYIPKSAEVVSGKQDRSWIPFIVRLNPRRIYYNLSKKSVIIGFPDIDQIYMIKQGGSEIKLSIHVFDNLVRGITISTNLEGQNLAKKIVVNIKAQHPFLPIRIKEDYTIMNGAE